MIEPLSSRVAISNLAWNPDEDTQIIEILKSRAVTGIELAPTKTWPSLMGVTEQQALSVKATYETHGLSICALQSLLFGRADLQLFGDDPAREEMKTLLHHVISIAGWLGAGALVFGSPKNRTRGSRSMSDAQRISVPFFRELGEHAARCNTALCIEPNPAVYGCDFVVTAEEGAELVTAVDSPGFGLHLDSAAMYLAGEDGAHAISRHAKLIRHFHISAPQLAPVSNDSPVPYKALLTALAREAYAGWVSIEMKQIPEGNDNDGCNIGRVASAIDFVRESALIAT